MEGKTLMEVFSAPQAQDRRKKIRKVLRIVFEKFPDWLVCMWTDGGYEQDPDCLYYGFWDDSKFEEAKKQFQGYFEHARIEQALAEGEPASYWEDVLTKRLRNRFDGQVLWDLGCRPECWYHDGSESYFVGFKLGEVNG